ncbi:unnamed protein product [marine sediment metagenome]|uniref:Uncharacterized protein n=1 Tax=marine sediment metagenome TaxID=412755 RepID=X1IU44_9ZZZZ
MNGIWDKMIIPSAIFVSWIGSFEIRLRNKVGRDEFNLVVAQGKLTQTWLWDIMKAQNITPSIEPPDEIKNNKRKET